MFSMTDLTSVSPLSFFCLRYFPCNYRKCMFLLLFLAGQLKHDIIVLSEECNDTDELYPHCKLTSCVGWHPDSWLFWPRCLYDTLRLHSQRFLSQNQELCTDNSCSLQGQHKLSQFILYTALGDLWGIICLFFRWPCCKFC